jgi:hypothetical protein
MLNEAHMLDSDELAERIHNLRQAHAPFMRDRIRIRQIMNGGPDAIRALLGNKAAAKLGSEDLPVVHLMDSGLTRLAQRLGRAPDVRVDPSVLKDTKGEKRGAEKRERILAGLDYQARLMLTMPYAGRWLPGYSFVPWTIVEGRGRSGESYAKAEIRNSFDCFPGQWGPDSQPEEIAFIRLASKRRLARQYPTYAAKLEAVASGPQYGPTGFGGAGGIWSPGRMAWEGPAGSDAVLLAEYIDSSGTYLMALDHDFLLDHVPNPLGSGPAFALARRPSFDQAKGQYDHLIGLMGMMAKLNVLAYMATEDAVFRETNIIGDMISAKYRRGRMATNFFATGTRVEKPTADVSFQVFNQIDRVERQLRIGANYSVVEDSESPNSFATGRGLDKLTEAPSINVGEYQTQMGFALELIDAKRLEWEERMYGSQLKEISANVRGTQINESYRPSKDIAGRYESRRVYGVMAGWDEPDKIVTGLQLLQAELIDHETMQDNLDGLENRTRVNDRIRQRKTEDRIYDILSQRASDGDPKAEMALVEIMSNPTDITEILTKFYTPEEPEMSPEEQALAAGLGGGGGPGGPGVVPPDDVSTVLSRLMSGGQADAGVQTVGRLAG